MTPEALAALHARCFDDGPPPWSVTSFAMTLAEASTFLIGAGDGFAVGRAAAGEAELLTLAVAPEARRRGLGATLLVRFEAEAQRRGAAQAFLEVAESNAAARRLYARGGYAEVGRRPGYYSHCDSSRVTALVLCKELSGTVSLRTSDGKTD